MEREETKTIVRKIHAVYQNSFKMDDPKFVIDTWHEVLKDYEFKNVNENLNRYMLEDDFAPKIKDLVNNLADNERPRIPGIEETKKIIAGYQVPKEKRIDPDVLQTMIDEMKVNVRRSKK